MPRSTWPRLASPEHRPGHAERSGVECDPEGNLFTSTDYITAPTIRRPRLPPRQHGQYFYTNHFDATGAPLPFDTTNGLVAAQGEWHIEKPISAIQTSSQLRRPFGRHASPSAATLRNYTQDNHWNFTDILTDVRDNPRFLDLVVTAAAADPGHTSPERVPEVPVQLRERHGSDHDRLRRRGGRDPADRTAARRSGRPSRVQRLRPELGEQPRSIWTAIRRPRSITEFRQQQLPAFQPRHHRLGCLARAELPGQRQSRRSTARVRAATRCRPSTSSLMRQPRSRWPCSIPATCSRSREASRPARPTGLYGERILHQAQEHRRPRPHRRPGHRCVPPGKSLHRLTTDPRRRGRGSVRSGRGASATGQRHPPASRLGGSVDSLGVSMASAVRRRAAGNRQPGGDLLHDGAPVLQFKADWHWVGSRFTEDPSIGFDDPPRSRHTITSTSAQAWPSRMRESESTLTCLTPSRARAWKRAIRV